MSLFAESRFSKFSFLLSTLTFFPSKNTWQISSILYFTSLPQCTILLLLLPTFSEYSLAWETSVMRMCLYLGCIYFTVLMFYSGSCTDSVLQTSYWATQGLLQKDLTNKELWHGKVKCSLASLVPACDMWDMQARCKIIFISVISTQKNKCNIHTGNNHL